MLYFKTEERDTFLEVLEMMAEMWSGTYVLGNPTQVAVEEMSWHPALKAA